MKGSTVLPSNRALALIFSALSYSVSSGSFAAPVISSAVFKESSSNGATITVSGSGFGEKRQAAPVLLDRVEESYENGTVNEAFQSITHGTKVPSTSKGKQSIWAGVTSGAWGSFTPEIVSQQAVRHDSSRKHYLLLGHNSTVGNPVAYGGDSGWDTPVDNNQLYVSWWFKPKYEPQWYWRLAPINLTGKFQKGETLNIGGIINATFIGVDEHEQINLVFQGNPPNVRDMKGQRILGEKSGAISTFPEESVGTGRPGFESPGSQKFIRIWEDPDGKEGIRFSWTQMHQTIGSVVNWSEAPLKGGEWNHLELEIDTKIGMVRLTVNTEELANFAFDPSLAYESRWSPTVASLGLNGKVGKLQESHLDDIYIDDSLQRVVLGNAPTIDQVTHYEVQRPIAWSDEKIKLEYSHGALKTSDTAYLYVFDSSGMPNSQGYSICLEC